MVQTHASDASLNEIMDVYAKKSSENSSKITCYAHCRDVFEDIEPFSTTRWNTFLKSVGIRKDLVANQASVAKAFLLDRGDTVQNEMTATKHKSFTPYSCPHAPVVKLPPVVDAVTSVVYQR